MKRTWKRMGALLLAVVMTLSLLPASALAARMVDDAVAIDAPDTAAQEATPAGAVDAIDVPTGAVDAEDVPATLADGNNIALNVAAYVSGIGNGYGANKAVDNDTGTYWEGNKLKDASTNDVYSDGVNWIVLDLWKDKDGNSLDPVASITGISINYSGNQAWPTDYLVQAAADTTSISFADYTAPTSNDKITADSLADRDKLTNTAWVTLKEYDRDPESNTSMTDTLAAADIAKVPANVRYIRLYMTEINSNARAATSTNVREITITGTRAPAPAVPLDLTALDNIVAGAGTSANTGVTVTYGTSSTSTIWTITDKGNLMDGRYTTSDYFSDQIPEGTDLTNKPWMIFDFGENRSIGGFELAVTQNDDQHGFSYNIYGQAAGSEEWTTCVENVAMLHTAAGHIKRNALTELAQFQKVKIVFHSGHDGPPVVAFTDFKVFGVDKNVQLRDYAVNADNLLKVTGDEVTVSPTGFQAYHEGGLLFDGNKDNLCIWDGGPDEINFTLTGASRKVKAVVLYFESNADTAHRGVTVSLKADNTAVEGSRGVIGNLSTKKYVYTFAEPTEIEKLTVCLSDRRDWSQNDELGLFGSALAEAEIYVLDETPVELPPYTAANIDAGLFDVGANPTKGEDGTWTANYSNPEEGSGTSKNGTVIKATALSYQNATSGDGIPYLAVDGIDNTNDKWHTRYNDNATGTTGEDLKADATKRYIQLEIVAGAQKLAGLRYRGNGGNGTITGYRIAVNNTDGSDSAQWTDVATGTWSNNNSWQYAAFESACEAKYVRLYATSSVSDDANKVFINAREIRLVKAGTDTYTFTGTVKDSAGNALEGATVSVEGKSATTGAGGSFSLADLPYPTCIATVTKDGYKTRAVELDAEREDDLEIVLYAPLSGDARTGVDNHLWDYPLWADVTDNGTGAAHRYTVGDGDIHGGSVTAFSWTDHTVNKADLPPWAAIDGHTDTHWHSYYSGANSNGSTEAAGNVGKWYEFTLGTPTKIIGLWYLRRSNGSNQPGNVTIKVSNADASPSAAEWAALPSAGSGNMNSTSNDWVFVELSAPVEAKYVRIYAEAPDTYVAIAELRVVMDPDTSGAKHIAGAVTASTGGAGIEGATLKVANHTATSGADGDYDLGYLPTGTYTVTASAPGYREKTQQVTISEDNELNIALEAQPLTLSVTVTGTGGNPVDGATVTLEQNDTGKRPVAGVAAVTGGTNGVYTLDATRAGMGTYVARVSHPDYNIGTAEVTFNNTTTEASVTVALTARSAPANTGGELVKTYDFSTAEQVADFVPLVESGGATVEHDAAKGAMKITFVDDANSYNNLILNKKFAIKNGSVEFDVTAEGTVADASDFGSVWRYGDGKWLHVGQLNAVNRYGATTHSSATASASYTGNVTDVAMGDGVTRRFSSILGELYNGSFEPSRSVLALESVTTGWKFNHTSDLLISNAVGLWGFDAKNAAGLVVYIDNLKVYRRDAQKGEVTIGPLSDGTLTVKTVTELDAEGTALTSGGNAYEGDTIKISAAGVSAGKVFAVKVTKTGDETTVVSVTKAADGSFTFTMPAYPVTITPSAATQLTGVTVTGANYGEETAKYARVGNTLTVSEKDDWGEGVNYQWQYSADGTAWTDIANANAATFVLTGSQYNSTHAKNQVRVKVTGKDVTYTGTVESAAVDVKEELVDVAHVTFTRSAITMWSNCGQDPVTNDEAVEGNTTVITATITPSTASRPLTVTWASSNEEVVSISNQSTTATEVTTEDGTVLTVNATLTALKAGSADITCTVTAKDSTAAQTATVSVTVNTGITSIALTKGGETLTSDSVLTIYANDGDANKSVTVNAAVNDGADAADLVWSCGHSEDGYAHIFQLGSADDAGAAAGGSVAITAYNNHTLVGEETVTVSAPATTGNTATAVSFKVKVVHKVDTAEHSVSIAGTPKVNNQLSVNLTNLPMSDTDKGSLTYQWKRTKTVEGTETTENVGTDATYTLGADDVGGKITVTVTATPAAGFYYEGSLTSAATAAVAKLDAPTAPTLSPTKPEPGQTKGYITITNYVSTQTYQIKSEDGSWGDATVTSDGKIEDLAPGTYSVKIKETATRKESAEASTTINDADAIEYTITPTQPTEGATITVTDKSAAGVPVTISLTVTEGWQVDAVKVNDSSEGVTKGTGNTWTFTMPEENVTVTAEVSKIQVKITHALSGGLSCSLTEHDEDGNHVVNYGEVHSITLTAEEAYDLPATIKVTYTDGTEAPTERCEYNNSTGVITFPQGVQRNITITATGTAKTYTASFSPATGGDLTRAFTSATPIAYNGTLTATLTPNAGYSAPAKESVQVTVGGAAADFTYTVNETTGVATVTVANVKGNVVIKADSANKILTPLTGVTIEIRHDDSNVSNQGVPHVGDVLKATPAAGGKENVTASYEWYVGGTKVDNAQSETYTVQAGDMGKKIYVVATGNGDFTGTATSGETDAVGEKVFTVDGVKIQNNGSDVTTTPIEVTFGGTLQLTAVVSPNYATNKKVTWSSSASAVATVDANGLVTAKGVGEATITVTTEDGGRQATCKVKVTAKDLTDDATATVRVGGTLELGQTVNAVLVPADAANGASYAWYIVDADGSNESHIMDTNGANATLPTDSSNLGKKVKLVVTYGGNYTGSKTLITENVIAGELPEHTISIAGNIANGSVTANLTKAKAGVTVTLTVTPANGYKLDTLTVTAGNYGTPVATDKVNETTYTFIVPGTLADSDAVNVTAAFVEETETPPVADKAGLKKLIEEAEALTEADYTAESWAALQTALSAAKVVDANEEATAEQIAAAAAALETAKDNLVEVPKVDTSALDAAITAAGNAKKNVQVKDADTDPGTVNKGTKYVTQEVMDALVAAIADAENVKKSPTATAEEIADAAEALNAAVETFNAAVQTGTKQTSSSSSSTTSSKTETKEDGSTVTTVTDTKTGETTVTTVTPDGGKEVVATKADGTVITTETAPNGVVTETVAEPDKEVTATVTLPKNVEQAVVTVPAEVSPTTVVVNAETGEIIPVAIATEDGMAVLLDSDAKLVIRDNAKDFIDVPGHWAEEAIHFTTAREIFNGTSETTFTPNGEMNRAMMVTILARFDGEDVTGGDTWYDKGAQWAVNAGISDGTNLSENITREQLVAMLYRYAQAKGCDMTVDPTDEAKFIDADQVSDWAQEAMQWAVSTGLIYGVGNNTLAPQDYATRAQVSAVIQRFVANLVG